MAEIGVHARGAPGLPEDHAEIPVWNSENWYFEDFEIGDKIRSTIDQSIRVHDKLLLTLWRLTQQCLGRERS